MTTQRMQVLNRKRTRKGETFVELLVAVLVVAFASLLVAVMYSASFQANIDAEENDKTYYGALSDMETMEEDGTELTVTLSDGTGSTTVDAEEYGNGTYFSYRKGENP